MKTQEEEDAETEELIRLATARVRPLPKKIVARSTFPDDSWFSRRFFGGPNDNFKEIK